MQNVFTKKNIPFPLKKLSRQVPAWIDSRKELDGRTNTQPDQTVIPKGIPGEQLKEPRRREKDGRFHQKGRQPERQVRHALLFRPAAVPVQGLRPSQPGDAPGPNSFPQGLENSPRQTDGFRINATFPAGISRSFPLPGHEDIKQPRKIVFRGCLSMFTEQMNSAAS